MKCLLICFGQSTKSPFTFFSASAGAACSIQAFVVTLIASGAAAAFIRSIYIVYKGTHGLVVSPRHVSFLLKEKK
jgi:hypothetical protein